MLFVRCGDEVQIQDYFTRECLERVVIGDHVKIECYDEMVFLSGELKKDSINQRLYLLDRNGFICEIEYGQVYERVWIVKD